ncbi:sensor histidine kinase KdpD [Deltaproteobacteria bacterium TL4]
MAEEENRPDPDLLLAALKKEEVRQHRGKLKIFFGMSAGVGKTYTMLQDAQEKQKEGMDVLVGVVETHNRVETEALLQSLKVFPRKRLEYRNVVLEEMDLDGILQRHPQLVLVDELAHSNVPGSRHLKRYQDILELLDAGINVSTTINVQHIESRTDIVSKITQIQVHETVPDSILDVADDIELIDITPDELLKRLADGKVYLGEQVGRAIQNFFVKSNLTALREMALRLTAERVDHQLQDYAQIKQLTGPWKSGERLMVAVSASPSSEELIRWTRRIAYNLEVPWVAAYVKTAHRALPKDEQRLAEHLELVQTLGGEIVVTHDEDVVAGLLRLARQHNITQIVVGQSPWLGWKILWQEKSLTQRLMKQAQGLDFTVVGAKHADSRWEDWSWQRYFVSGIKEYALALGITLGVLLSCFVLEWIDSRSVGLILLFMVCLLSLWLHRGPVLAAAAMSALLWNFAFLQPKFTFYIHNINDVLTFVLYFVIALVTGHLTTRLHSREQAIRHNEKHLSVLYNLSREFSTAVTVKEVITHAEIRIGDVFMSPVVVMLSDASGQLINPLAPSTTTPQDAVLSNSLLTAQGTNKVLSEKEFGVATWIFKNRKQAGKFTDTLPMADYLYLPLTTASGIVGALGIKLDNPLEIEQKALLEALSGQLALVIERTCLTEIAKESQVVAESKRLYKTLLNSISHELKTPLVTIAGATASLLDSHVNRHEEIRSGLVNEIQTATERLKRVVENLLDMTRLEAGYLKPHRDWCDVSDLVSVALKRTAPQLIYHRVETHLPPDLPLVRFDFVLLEQVLINLLDNAATYTPAGTLIEIFAAAQNQELLLMVVDHGVGVKAEDLEKIFEKFYRVEGSPPGGTGLGLSICRGLVEAHQGKITAEHHESGGLRFIIRLPLETPPSHVQETTL